MHFSRKIKKKKTLLAKLTCQKRIFTKRRKRRRKGKGEARYVPLLNYIFPLPYGGGDTDAEPSNLSGRQPYTHTASPGFRREGRQRPGVRRISPSDYLSETDKDRRRRPKTEWKYTKKEAQDAPLLYSHFSENCLCHTAEEIRMQNRRTYPGASRIRIRQVPDFGGRDASVPVCAVYPRRIICRRQTKIGGWRAAGHSTESRIYIRRGRIPTEENGTK